MADEIPRGPEPRIDADQQDDVLGKIDQLLNRHRPKTSISDAAPVQSDSTREESAPFDDGIPILRDVVSGPGRSAKIASSPAQPGTISAVLLLRRLSIALDAEHIRLLAQIDRNDAAQARMLDRLVGELKRMLPGAVRAALGQNRPAPSRSDDDGQL